MDQEMRVYLEGMEKRRSDETMKRDQALKSDLAGMELRQEARLAEHAKGFREDINSLHEKVNKKNEEQLTAIQNLETKIKIKEAEGCPDVKAHVQVCHDPVKKLKTAATIISVILGGATILGATFWILKHLPSF